MYVTITRVNMTSTANQEEKDKLTPQARVLETAANQVVTLLFTTSYESFGAILKTTSVLAISAMAALLF
jgi:hypothetical protein